MLTRLREQSQSFLIFILFGMLIVVFIFFFGPQSQGWQPGQTVGNQTGSAARVNGQEIDAKEIEINVRRFARDDISEPAQLIKLRDEARKQVIDQVILTQRATNLGFTPSEEELSKFIVGEENFDSAAFRDNNGNFDYDQYYAQITQYFGTSVHLYRQSKAREMVIRDYLGFLNAQIKVSDAEVKDAYERKERKWRLDYLAVDPMKLTTPLAEPTAEQGLAYATANPEEVKKYYDEHIKDYKRSKEVKISRILVRFSATATPEEKAKAKAKAEDLHKQAIIPGADFAALAEAHSEGYYKDFKGSMGWQGEGNSGAKDYKVFAALEKGQISTVQESGIGFWFVKADDVKPAIDKSLESVKGEIGVILAKEASRKGVAKKEAEALLARVKAGESMEAVGAVAAAPEPTPAPEDVVSSAPAASKVKTTGFITEERPKYNTIPEIGESAELAKRLLTLTDKDPLVNEVIEAGDRFYVIRLKERVEPDMKKFEEEKRKLKQRLIAQKGSKLFGNWTSLLFGPPQQREMMLSFGGGALLPSLKDSEVVLNQEVMPSAPAPQQKIN